MATDIAVFDLRKYPALADGASEAMAINLAGEKMSEFDLDQLKVPAGGGTSWDVPTLEGAKAAKEVTGVMVNILRRRSYWASTDPSGDPPDCFSLDMEKGIGDPGGECESCPMNQFGSASNERGKACKETRSIFLLREGDALPIVVHVPPGSLLGLKKYLFQLAQQSVPYFTGISRLSLDQDKNKDGIKFSKIAFEFVGRIDEEGVAAIRGYARRIGESVQ